MQKPNVTISTFNVGGLKKRPSKILDLFEKVKTFDICIFQETHFYSVSDLLFFNQIFEAKYKIFHSLAKSHSSGICILFSNWITVDLSMQIFEIPGRCLAFKFPIHNEYFILCGVYTPAQKNGRDRFFTELLEKLRGVTDFSNIILSGDFNFVENPSIDRYPESNRRQFIEPGFRSFLEIKQAFSLEDVFRNSNPLGKIFTFVSHFKTMSRIDRCYVSVNLLETCVDCKSVIIPDFQHRLFISYFRFGEFNKFGPSYWKMNTLNLEKEDLIIVLNNILGTFRVKSQHIDGEAFIIMYEMLKIDISEACKRYAIEVSRHKKSVKTQMERDINFLLRKTSLFPENYALKDELALKVSNLRNFHSEEIRSRLHKTHYHSFLQGQHTLASAKRSQKLSNAEKIFHSLLSINGCELFNLDDIIPEMRQQFSQLFSKGKIDNLARDYMLGTPKNLDYLNFSILEGEIKEQEIECVINELKTNKSPGIDGFPSEFFKKFKSHLCPILYKLFNVIYKYGKLPSSMYFGVITQIFKGKGNRNSRENWRPITLLNVDYKILTKVLFNRLKIIAKDIIDVDQTCSIPGRDIRQGIFTIFSVIDKVNYYSENGIVMSVDQKAAFDMVEWEYLWKTLAYFGIPPCFIKWIKMIYLENHVKSTVAVNGFLSEFFMIGRGLRQGCPLSPLLYIFVAESLANKIRDDSNICGIKLGNFCVKLSNYADDINFMLSDYNSVRHIFDTFEIFRRASGATVNNEKTQILLLGNFKKPPKGLEKFIVQHIKIYGVYFNYKGFDVKKSFESSESKIRHLLSLTAHSEFSLESKSIFMNTFFLSKFFYCALFMTPTEDLFDLTNKAVTRFLWYPSRKPKIKSVIAHRSRKDGGVGLPNLKMKILAFRLMFLIKINNYSSTKAFQWFLNRYVTLKTASRRSFSSHPNFYSELLNAENSTGIDISSDEIVLYGQPYIRKNTCTKKIYNIVICKSSDRPADILQKMWRQILNEPSLNLSSFWKNNFVKFADARSNDIHFLLTNNALVTRIRISKWDKNTTEFCKYCWNHGKRERETNLHAIIHCDRIVVFWNRICKLLNLYGFPSSNPAKIFGIENPENSATKGLINAALQIAQRVIWNTRIDYETKMNEIDIWKRYKTTLKNVWEKYKKYGDNRDTIQEIINKLESIQ